MRKFKFISCIVTVVIIVSFFSSFSSVLAIDEPEVQANAFMLYEADSDTILYEKNVDTKVYPASLTKITTVLLAIEAYESGSISLDSIITASDDIYYDIDSTENSDLHPGETVSFKDLLYYAMVSSSNEACNILAEAVAGSPAEFIALMNKRVNVLGCNSTNYTNTHGLHNDNHYTTVHDLHLIIKEAMSHSLFMDIVSTATYTTSPTNMMASKTIANTNRMLINGNAYYYKYAKGIKTGYTSNAGYCLAAAAEMDGVTLVSIVMGAKSIIADDGTTKTLSFSESKRLIEWGYSNFSYQTILSTSDLITEIPVTLGSDASSVVVRPASDISKFMESDVDKSKISYTTELNYNSGAEDDDKPFLQAPVAEGDELGTITVLYDGEEIGTTSLVANVSVELSKIENIKKQISNIFTSIYFKIIISVVVLIIILYIIYVIKYNIDRRKRNNYTGRKRRRR